MLKLTAHSGHGEGQPQQSMSHAEREKFRLLTTRQRYGEVKVQEFIYEGYRKQKIEKTQSEVALMRDRLKKVEKAQAQRRKAEEITEDEVELMLKNLENVKANSRNFLTAQANKALRDEIAANYQRLAAKLFQAAAAGNCEECLEILRDEANAAKRLAQLGGPDDLPYVEGQPSALVNAVDADDRRPLHYAANHGDEDVVEALLAAGADESAVDCNGYTALHYACRWVKERAVDRLVWAPLNDINATDSFGQTALHVAAASGGSSLVNVLVMRGARPSQKDHEGNTPMDIAKLHGDTDFAAAVELATRVDPAGLVFGPGEFDIVKNTETMTDEREMTAAIISEVFELGKASTEELDDAVFSLENTGAQTRSLVLGAEVPHDKFPRDRTLKEQIANDRVAFRSVIVPDYKGLASLIAAAGPSDDF